MKVYGKITKQITNFILMIGVTLFSLAVTLTTAEAKSAALLSYGDWKSQTRQDIQKKVHSIEQKLSDQKDGATVASTSKIVSKPEKKQVVDHLQMQLSFEKIKLEASEDLSFHEYFLSYLNEQKDFDQKVAELAKVLKPEDIRELIASYSNLVQKKKHDGQHGYKTSPIDD